jgi:predicted TIM-barrel fold metal-dependent hydrolase
VTPAATEGGQPRRDPTQLRAIDVDVHHEIPDWRAVAPHVPEGLRWRVLRPNGPPMARHGFKPVGTGSGDGPWPPTAHGKRARPASDPNWVKVQHLEKQGIDLAVLTGNLHALGVQPNLDLSAAIARGVNDWALDTWIRPHGCFKGSILIAQQDPTQAAAEIDRLGDDPGMVQVLMGSASESPFGRRFYHPIYEACVRHHLPLALHIGGEGAGISRRPTAAGDPTTYFEWYGSLPQSYMGHIVSMVSEGVFERYPELKVVLYEGGVGWLPHLIWRFDKNWKAQYGEVPWLVHPPSHYILNHFYSTSYPLEWFANPSSLNQILAMIRGERTLLFASSYPNLEYGDPFDMIRDVSVEDQRRVLVENALAVYGERLLVPNTRPST